MNPPRVLTVPSRVTVCKVYTVRLQRPISLCRTENSVGSPEKVNRAGTRAGSGLRVKTLRAEKSIIDRSYRCTVAYYRNRGDTATTCWVDRIRNRAGSRARRPRLNGTWLKFSARGSPVRAILASGYRRGSSLGAFAPRHASQTTPARINARGALNPPPRYPSVGAPSPLRHSVVYN